MQTAFHSYKKLIVYQKSKDLIFLVYKITKKFPKSELFILLPQMRRSVISVAANIVEGYIKKSPKEFNRFLNISIGSLTELEFYLELSFDMEYFDKMEHETALNLLTEVKKLLYSFQKSLRVKG